MAKLRPVFRKDGTITAGNASAITDGAAAIVVLSEEAAKQHGVTPQAAVLRLHLAWAWIPRAWASPRCPRCASCSSGTGSQARGQIDVIELNEAFASQVLACDRELHFDRERLNPNGGGIALGHPTGCSGTRIMVTLLHELARRRRAATASPRCA